MRSTILTLGLIVCASARADTLADVHDRARAANGLIQDDIAAILKDAPTMKADHVLYLEVMVEAAREQARILNCKPVPATTNNPP